MAVGDALALLVSRMRDFTAEDFALFHPAGSLGRKLARVEEVMRTDRQLRRAHVDRLEIRTDQPYATSLQKFFRMRERQR